MDICTHILYSLMLAYNKNVKRKNESNNKINCTFYIEDFKK